MKHTLIIIGMAAITFFTKAFIFVLGDRVVFPVWLKEALVFFPVTVLTAIIVPMVLTPDGEGIALSWRNPQLIAGYCWCARRQGGNTGHAKYPLADIVWL